MIHWNGWTGKTFALPLGGALRFLPDISSMSMAPGRLEPGSIGVKLAGISSADGLHSRSGLNAIYDDNDDAWWEARAGLSNVLISNWEGIAVLQKPEEAMLLCMLPAHP